MVLGKYLVKLYTPNKIVISDYFASVINRELLRIEQTVLFPILNLATVLLSILLDKLPCYNSNSLSGAFKGHCVLFDRKWPKSREKGQNQRIIVSIY